MEGATQTRARQGEQTALKKLEREREREMAGRRGGGASEYLTNLPSRGLFSSSTVTPSNPGSIRVYVCEHDTSAPEEQLIKTNLTNILIRSLKLNLKDVKGKATTEKAGKRAAERPAEGKGPAKRASTAVSSRSTRQGSLPSFELRPSSTAGEGSSSHTSEMNFKSLTVEKLRAILKERALPTRGKKDELIARLRGHKADGEK
ncbi:hypothetical protein GIB67_009332 [Kingdonia uniflora]|uniref:SAP domain-containing protein n=1 Tax=Kingdonia uniflora TaxID=39325 RepID=A0A7J7N2U8_9MAGN|nr:hypothetical protein GIB67_009332 [Kingdonia uniflora]